MAGAREEVSRICGCETERERLLQLPPVNTAEAEEEAAEF